MSDGQRSSLRLGEACGRPKEVLDGAAVDLELSQYGEDFGCPALLVDVDDSGVGFEDIPPYDLPHVVGDLFECQRDVDAVVDGVVEIFVPVGGQEEDSFVIFHQP